MILPLPSLDIRNCPLTISCILPLRISCLWRGKEYHTSPHKNVFSFTKQYTHQLAFTVGTFSGAWGIGYQLPVTFTKSQMIYTEECLWKSSTVGHLAMAQLPFTALPSQAPCSAPARRSAHAFLTHLLHSQKPLSVLLPTLPYVFGKGSSGASAA